MSDLLAEQRYDAYQQYEQRTGAEQPVLFLTTREAAMATSAAAMGPLAMMFEHTESLGVPHAQPAVAEAALLVEAFEAPEVSELEVPTVSPERLQGRAALYYTATQYNLN